MLEVQTFGWPWRVGVQQIVQLAQWPKVATWLLLLEATVGARLRLRLEVVVASRSRRGRARRKMVPPSISRKASLSCSRMVL